MDVLFLSPGHPSEMPEFVRGLSEVGARVWGIGSEPVAMLPETARRHLSGYLQVPNLWAEDDVVQRVQRWLGDRRPDRVETLAEYSVVLAAKLREALGVSGLRVEQAIAFRDKEKMKQVLDKVKSMGEVDKASKLRTVAALVRTANLIAGSHPLVSGVKAQLDTALKNHDVTV